MQRTSAPVLHPTCFPFSAGLTPTARHGAVTLNSCALPHFYHNHWLCLIKLLPEDGNFGIIKRCRLHYLQPIFKYSTGGPISGQDPGSPGWQNIYRGSGLAGDQEVGQGALGRLQQPGCGRDEPWLTTSPAVLPPSSLFVANSAKEVFISISTPRRGK